MLGHTDMIAALKIHTLAHHEGGMLAWCVQTAMCVGVETKSVLTIWGWAGRNLP
eukprot:COSAG02_NODE_40520_length_404_cov_1.173770_1_plen_53_part_10